MNLQRALLRSLPLAASIALAACGGTSKKVEPPPPPPPPPTNVFTAVGGEGLAGHGGAGGYLFLENNTAGDVKVQRAGGTVDVSVNLPTQLPYLGTNAVDVIADTTLEIGTSGFRLGDGAYEVSNDTGRVTGIRVRPGVTLTIKPNFPAASPHTSVEFNLSDGLIVEGTIKIAKQDATTAGDGAGTDTAAFLLGDGYIWSGNSVGGLWIAEGGKIDVSGAGSTTAAGGNGGAFQALPDAIFSAGTVDTSGGAGATGGGTAGGITIYTWEGYAVNTGSLLADGGAGGTGQGGSASSITFESYNGYGYLVSSGTVSATGGSGGTGGGTGGDLDFYTDYGAMFLSGTVRTHGGDATTGGTGGAGGHIYTEPYGMLRVAGSFDTHGGDGAGTGDGGDGGYLEFEIYENYSWGNGEDQGNSQSVAFGASVNTSGGRGANGGDAGYFELYTESEYTSAPGGSPITLVGYPTIDVSGGNGTTDGGSAGSYWRYHGLWPDIGDNVIEAWGDYDGYDQYYAGSAINEADIVGRGGNGGTGYGGDGSGLRMETEGYVYAPYDFGTRNSGAIDGTGGNGATSGGIGGYFHLYGKYFLESTGALTAAGGNGGSAEGGSGSFIDLYSEGPITSSGALISNGGASTDIDGTGGGEIYVSTSQVCAVSGAITASGGNSTSATAGNGGYVWVMSQENASTVTATLSVPAGTGATGTPQAGEVWVDGLQIAGP